MTTLSNSEGKYLTYTNGLIETILLHINSSSNYYTSGDDCIIFIQICYDKVLILYYTYHIDRNIFQNYTINENTINDYNLEFILSHTSNGYTIQGVCTANGFIGSINELQQVFLAIYGTGISSYTYTGSENINVTNNEISLTFPLNINDGVVLNPRLHVYFEVYAGTSGFSFYKTS